ncbi:glyoxylate/hydroxypyruvate reductase A [Massilia sp. W12]|uniref:2-hydroxyacid dehydrogenase n=1 Tax=Massilia sp. W12 TaxID=3126507 RepID=UPI0030D54482
MRILFYSPDADADSWTNSFAEIMPGVELHFWQEGQTMANSPPADYAVVWRPPLAMLQGRTDIKAVFNLGAGVDALLKYGEALPEAPIVRLDDAGMGVQMAEFVSHAVLRYYRRFDEYEEQSKEQLWQVLKPHDKQQFSVGILGLGVLGQRIAQALQQFEFPLLGWSHTMKNVPGVQCFAGRDQLDAFLSQTRVLVCVLPLTAETSNMLGRANLSKLMPGAYLINVARGAHLAEPDLLALIKSGHIAGATLDVFRNEPLPRQHPFWHEPRIRITPHIAALTLFNESIRQIAGKIAALEKGEAISGVVDRVRGY